MKAFKLYVKEGGTKAQLIWLGALLIIVGIVIASLGIYNYFTIPQEAVEEFVYSPHALILKELYLSAGMGIIGVVLFMAGVFSAKGGKEDKQ